jgi:hypothetical protein
MLKVNTSQWAFRHANQVLCSVETNLIALLRL